MTDSAPAFGTFLRWLAHRHARRPARPGPDAYEALLRAAREARDAVVHDDPAAAAAPDGLARGRRETLRLLAAATPGDDTSALPELVTARGFRVMLAYDEGARPRESSLCVLVRCPSALVGRLQGRTAWLWSGSERFELGQFDAEGKAIGTLPAGIEITLTDFSQGRVALEGPDPDA